MDFGQIKKTTNLHAYSLITCAFIVSFILFILNVKVMACAAIVVGIFFFIPVICNHFNRYKIARLALLINFNLAIYIFSTALGRDSSTHIWYYTAAISPFGLFDLRERFALLFSIALAFFSLLFLMMSDFQYSLMPVLVVDPHVLKIISIMMTFLSNLIAIIDIYLIAQKLFDKSKQLEGDIDKIVRSDEKKYMAVVENLQDYAVMILNPKGIITTWNKGVLNIKGYEASEVIGRHFSIFFSKDDQESGVPANILNKAKELGHSSGEGIRIKKSGERIWTKFNIDSILNKNGEIVGFSKVTHDVTSEKRNFEKISLTHAIDTCLSNATNEKQVIDSILRTFVQHFSWKVGIFWTLDKENKLLKYSGDFAKEEKKFKKFTESSKLYSFHLGEGIPGKVWKSHRVEWIDDISIVENFPRKSIALEANLIKGFSFPIEFSGEFIGCVEFFHDIRALQFDRLIVDVFEELIGRIGQRIQFLRASEEARYNHTLLQNILDGYPESIYLRSRDGRFQIVNQPFLKKLNLTQEKIIGTTLYDHLSEDMARLSEQDDYRVLSTKKAFVVERAYEDHGVSKNYLVHRFPLFDDQSEVVSVCTFTVDITQEYRLKNELEKNMRWQQGILDGANSSIISTDVSGVIQTFNRQAEVLLGYKADEVIGKKTPAMIHLKEEVIKRAEAISKELGEIVEPGFDTFVAKAKKGLADESEWIYVHKDGHQFPVLLTVTALFNEKKEISGYLGIATDITEKKLAENRLKESERRLKYALEGSNDGIWDWDLVKGEMYISENLANFFGYPQQISLKSVDDMAETIHPEDWAQTRRSIVRHLEGNSSIHEAEARLLTSKGEWVWILTRGKISERSKDGTPLRMTGVHIQINVMKKIEKELQEAHWQALAQKNKSDALLYALDTSAIVAVTDVSGKITMVNDTFCRVSGYSREELLGKDHRMINSKAHPKSFFKNMWDTINAGKLWKGEICNRKKSGELYWLSSSIVPQKNAQGLVEGFISIRFEVTKQKEMENQLVNTANSVPALISHWDKHYHNKFSNRACYDWFSINAEQMQEVTFPQLIGEESFEVTRPYVEAALKGFPQRYERELKRVSDGSMRKVIISYFPDKVKDEVMGFFLCVQDITELKLAEEKAIEASKVKAQFLANMGHEIRTPLNGILGMTEILAETALKADQRKFLSIIEQSGNLLLTLVNDILDFSKIESGKFELEKVKFSLRKTVEVQCDVLAARAEDKKISLQSFIDPNISDLRIGDPNRIGQILLNLISNAVKFTTIGGVQVKAYRPQDKEESIVRFEVIDSGVGISLEHQRKLFQPFTQVDGSTARKYGGTGLGLSISKELVGMMQGEIGLISKENEGSTFWFEIPLMFEEKEKKENRFFHRTRVLIYSADSIQRQILEQYLKSWGIEYEKANSLEEIIPKLEEAKIQNHPFRILFLDYDGQTNDCFQLINDISDRFEQNELKTILVAPISQVGSIKWGQEKGISKILYRPIKQSELFDGLVNSFFENVRADKDVLEVAANPIENKGLSILVAEDVIINQIIAVKFISSFGYQVEAVENGIKVLEMYQKMPFDLILMDCQMPEMDGFETTKKIRELEMNTGKHIPIVALTANAMAGDDTSCISAGMDDYLSKPIKKENLKKMLEKWLRK